MEEYSLIVIGSGPAGRRAAIQAAKFGETVLVVERGRRVGGVSAGCRFTRGLFHQKPCGKPR